MSLEDLIKNQIPPEMASFIIFPKSPAPINFQEQYNLIAIAFGKACEYLQKAIRLRSAAYVFLGEDGKFTADLKTGTLTYTTKSDTTISCHLERHILIDCKRLIQYPFELVVTCILEELVHVFMNVGDELLTRQIVAYLHPNICLDQETKYTVNKNSPSSVLVLQVPS